ncbi:hypothetical protein QR680_008660 [Steinernema hermaphroditum]|uniref:Acid phosphatase n=1 Tax=Steinernema hermaphroditum TaxID=289476 RepID=A0AA39IJN8_9BILA|nr:hypothetical protein QR680_008660 [Steinernema hermaphroditum]
MTSLFPSLLLLLLVASAPFAVGAKLLQIQALWRHGDRAPIGTYPTDPHQEDAWPVPWGELTTEGMWQLYQQGEKLKKEYIEKRKLISSNYTASEIYLRSSNVSRTIISAHANMVGFYSSLNEDTLWPTNWSPVPVHVAKEGDLVRFTGCAALS